jgi:hypothetical protein
MNITKTRPTTALVLLVLLLVATTWSGISFKHFGRWDVPEWIYAFCLTQTILLSSWAVYGPGRLVVRLPFVVAWGLAIGFALARLNLISSQGRASLVAGAILVATGALSPLILFSLHRWRTGASLTLQISPGHHVLARTNQLSLRMMLTLTAAFAVTCVIARGAITAAPDPFGNEHDILVIHAWLGFFPCLAAAPVLLVVFRPTWRIVFVGFYFLLVALIEPLSLGHMAPYILADKSLIGPLWNWDALQEAWSDSLFTSGQALVATVVYALLARAAGFRMIYPDQSNDKNPNPSGLPETDAG